MLKHTKIAMAAGLSIAALLPAIASARTDVSIGVGIGGYAPVYEAPAPVYYAPPPPAYYYAPAPVSYRSTVVYGRPYWDGHRWCRDGEGWREHHGGWRD